jgi:hypothetical protein
VEPERGREGVYCSKRNTKKRKRETVKRHMKVREEIKKGRRRESYIVVKIEEEERGGRKRKRQKLLYFRKRHRLYCSLGRGRGYIVQEEEEATVTIV